jgi:hypothetical protein
VSARHQVKRPLPAFDAFALSEAMRQKKRFSSFGADLRGSAVSPAPKPKVKSGPDVFADALVPGTLSFLAAAADARRLNFPAREMIVPIRHGAFARWLSFCEAAG